MKKLIVPLPKVEKEDNILLLKAHLALRTNSHKKGKNFYKRQLNVIRRALK